jgi:hypothetical protein
MISLFFAFFIGVPLPPILLLLAGFFSPFSAVRCFPRSWDKITTAVLELFKNKILQMQDTLRGWYAVTTFLLRNHVDDFCGLGYPHLIL